MQDRVRSEARAARMRARWADPAYAAKMREAARRGAASTNARRRRLAQTGALGPTPSAPSLASVERALVARLGVVVFAVCLGLPAIISTSAARASVVVASVEGVSAVAAMTAPDVEPLDLTALQLPVDVDAAVADVTTALVHSEPEAEAASEPEPVPVATTPPVVLGAAAPPDPSWPPPEPLVSDGVVVASWYGPGFYGNTTACGQIYTPEILGVAHRTLPCGTQIRIASPAGRTVVVSVIDRGPFIAGRALDLSNATREALSCSDLCHVRMTIVP